MTLEDTSVRDVVLKRKDGITELHIHQFMPWKNIKYAEFKLMAKIKAYKDYIKSEEGIKRYGKNIEIVLKTIEEPPQIIKDILEKEKVKLERWNMYHIKFYMQKRVTEKEIKKLLEILKRYVRPDAKEMFLAKTKNSSELTNIINNAKEGSNALTISVDFNFYPKEATEKVTIFTPEGEKVMSVKPLDKNRVDISFGKEENYITLTVEIVNASVLSIKNINDQNDLGFKNQKMLLDFAKEVYDIFRPIIGISNAGLEAPNISNWINNLEIKSLEYDWYFLGPEYVKKYGKEKLLKISGVWIIKELEGNGIAIALFPITAWPVLLNPLPQEGLFNQKKLEEVHKQFASIVLKGVK